MTTKQEAKEARAMYASAWAWCRSEGLIPWSHVAFCKCETCRFAVTRFYS